MPTRLVTRAASPPDGCGSASRPPRPRLAGRRIHRRAVLRQGRRGLDATTGRRSFPRAPTPRRSNERLPDFLGGDSIPAVVVVDGRRRAERVRARGPAGRSPTTSPTSTACRTGVSPPIASEDGEAVQIFVPIDTSGEVARDRRGDPHARRGRAPGRHGGLGDRVRRASPPTSSRASSASTDCCSASR